MKVVERALTFTSEVLVLEAVRDFVREATLAVEPSEAALYRLQLVVVEAVTNVIEHAYEGEAGRPIELEIACQGRTVKMTLRDRGRPFDLVSHPDPDISGHLTQGQKGGLGVFLMRQLLEELSLQRENGWNVLRMRFAVG